MEINLEEAKKFARFEYLNLKLIRLRVSWMEIGFQIGVIIMNGNILLF